MPSFEIKIQKLIEIVELEIKKMEKNFEYFYEDEVFKRVLEIYKKLLEILKKKNKHEIEKFQKNLINKLSKLNLDNTVSYEINEYYNIVFYIYNLFSNNEFNRSDYMQCEHSNNNLNIILQKIKDAIYEG